MWKYTIEIDRINNFLYVYPRLYKIIPYLGHYSYIRTESYTYFVEKFSELLQQNTLIPTKLMLKSFRDFVKQEYHTH